jgi:uracil-DNA glycosylase
MPTTPWEEGDPDSRIAIVGEAPARMEMKLRRPLVGPAGYLLEQCMHSAGMVRRECYIINVFEEQVSKDIKGRIFGADKELLWLPKTGFTEEGDRRAQPAIERLAACKANVVVPLGGTALSFLYPDTRIMKWRGSILSATRKGLEGRKVIATAHPAASLRGNYIWRYFIMSDLRRAKEESLSPAIDLPDRILRIQPTYTDAMAFLTDMRRGDRVCIDIECLNHQVSCMSFCSDPLDVMSIPFVGERGGPYWTEEQEDNIWLTIAQILGAEDVMKIGQNISFDIGFLFQQNNIITRGKLGDTMVAHHIIWPDFPKGLDFLCSVHTREPYYKDDGKLWSRPWADIHTFWEYNARDSATTLEVWDAVQKDLDEGFRQTYEDTMELLDPVVYMMTRGMKVNRDRLEVTKKAVAIKLAQKEHELNEIAEVPFNPSSPKQCIEYFYGTKGIKPYINRKTGQPTTDDKALARIVRKHNLKEARICQEIRTLRKLEGTYLEVGIDKDDRIRCSYNLRGTRYGRLSSSQTITGTGMNMQNLHPEFKGFLEADRV